MTSPTATANPYRILPDGRLQFKAHKGQKAALESRARFILVLAGWQSGKTLIGPRWMLEEIARKGPGEYLVASPTFPLMDLKVLPEYKNLFVRKLRLGKLTERPRPVFTLDERGKAFMKVVNPALWEDVDTETLIRFGHAADPDSLESATYKGAHLDEPGQKRFKVASWEAIRGRLSIFMGRALLTTRPYYLGWLKNKIYDRAKAGDPNYDVIQFRSIDNPAFPREEYEERKRTLPAWKFRMKYDGEFDRPAGLIYENFSRLTHCVKRFPIPAGWERHMGIDFGGVNTAAVFFAKEPGDKGRFFCYKVYHAGGRTKGQHVEAMTKSEPMTPDAVGGAWSEDQWRLDFGEAGLFIRRPPVKGVEEGIDRVFALLGGERNADEPLPIRLLIFDDLEDLIDDFESYSRVLGDDDEPTEKIEDKDTHHKLDAVRYFATTAMQEQWLYQ